MYSYNQDTVSVSYNTKGYNSIFASTRALYFLWLYYRYFMLSCTHGRLVYISSYESFIIKSHMVLLLHLNMNENVYFYYFLIPQYPVHVSVMVQSCWLSFIPKDWKITDPNFIIIIIYKWYKSDLVLINIYFTGSFFLLLRNRWNGYANWSIWC